MKLSLLPEDQTLYNSQLHRATHHTGRPILDLAWLLQSAAEVPARAAPAPLYLQQACVIADSSSLRDELTKALAALAREGKQS